MGIYTETTYARHGRHWRETLFYSHALGLCFSVFLLPSLVPQGRRLFSPGFADTWGGVPGGPGGGAGRDAGAGNPFDKYTNRPWRDLSSSSSTSSSSTTGLTHALHTLLTPVFNRLPHTTADHLTHLSFSIPPALPLLTLNALTQVACISGVNRLSSVTTAVTVTIVLNLRKLTSFLLSCLIFGNRVGGLGALGAGVVFLAGGVYGWDSSRRGRRGPQGQPQGQEGAVLGGGRGYRPQRKESLDWGRSFGQQNHNHDPNHSVSPDSQAQPYPHSPREDDSQPQMHPGYPEPLTLEKRSDRERRESEGFGMRRVGTVEIEGGRGGGFGFGNGNGSGSGSGSGSGMGWPRSGGGKVE